jgi:hypothetical protein
MMCSSHAEKRKNGWREVDEALSLEELQMRDAADFMALNQTSPARSSSLHLLSLPRPCCVPSSAAMDIPTPSLCLAWRGVGAGLAWSRDEGIVAL